MSNLGPLRWEVFAVSVGPSTGPPTSLWASSPWSNGELDEGGLVVIEDVNCAVIEVSSSNSRSLGVWTRVEEGDPLFGVEQLTALGSPLYLRQSPTLTASASVDVVISVGVPVQPLGCHHG